ncbi:TPA: helix-turn-helix transcriptional regulator [Escherichia coli]|nr:helix-turn-helix transcriptional regulator [Escherichia coli]
MLFTMMTDKEIISEFCVRLKNARMTLGMSQRELAIKAKIGIATVKRIESGETINFHTLSVLRALGAVHQMNFVLNDFSSEHVMSSVTNRKSRKIFDYEKREKQNTEHRIFNEIYYNTMKNTVEWLQVEKKAIPEETNDYSEGINNEEE